MQPHLRAAAAAAASVGSHATSLASSGSAVSSFVERSRHFGSTGIGGSLDRSNDSNGHNSDEDTGISGGEDEDGNIADPGNPGDGKNKSRKKKTRTVFSRSQVRK